MLGLRMGVRARGETWWLLRWLLLVVVLVLEEEEDEGVMVVGVIVLVGAGGATSCMYSCCCCRGLGRGVKGARGGQVQCGQVQWGGVVLYAPFPSAAQGGACVPRLDRARVWRV